MVTNSPGFWEIIPNDDLYPPAVQKLMKKDPHTKEMYERPEIIALIQSAVRDYMKLTELGYTSETFARKIFELPHQRRAEFLRFLARRYGILCTREDEFSLFYLETREILQGMIQEEWMQAQSGNPPLNSLDEELSEMEIDRRIIEKALARGNEGIPPEFFEIL